MQHVSKPLLDVWRELAAMHEAREINRAALREALDRKDLDRFIEDSKVCC